MKFFRKYSRISVFAALLLLSTVGMANAESSSSPNLPQAFYGSITAADGGRINGGTVQAVLDGEVFSLSFSGTSYGSPENLGERLLVWSGNTGGNITFKVNGIEAAPTVAYVPGEITALNLTIPHGTVSGGGGGAVPEAGRSASGGVEADRDTVVQDSTGTLELTIPAGAVQTADGAAVKVTVDELVGSEADEVLRDVKVPQGVNSTGTAFEIKAEAGDSRQSGTITAFNKPVTFSLQLSNKDLKGVSDPEKVGIFKLNSDGTLTFAGGKYVEDRLVTPIYESGKYVVAEVNIEFTDMNNHWAQNDVELTASKYIAQGYPGGKFAPDGDVTRVEFACMLVRALQLRGTQGTPDFNDVSATDWFYNELQTAVDSGIIKGFTDGTFRPNALVSREEVAAMVARALKTAGKADELTAEQLETIASGFSDYNEVDDWAKAELALAAKAGILKGKTASSLEPKASATRAESAVMISRFWRK